MARRADAVAVSNLAIVPIPRRDRVSVRALADAVSLRQPVVALHVSPTEEESKRFCEYWHAWGNHVPLELVQSSVPCRHPAGRRVCRIPPCTAARAHRHGDRSGPRRPSLVAATATRRHGGPAAPRARPAFEGCRHQRSVSRLEKRAAPNAAGVTVPAVRAAGRGRRPRRDRGRRASRRCGAGAS